MTSESKRTVDVPALSLVVLIGASGSGKSTFAARHFARTEVISSDFCRGLVADDENDQSASRDAFDVLHYIAGKRLAAGRLTVIDATNVQPEARKQLITLAKEHDVLPVAIVLDLPGRVCLDRNQARADRTFGSHVINRQRDQLRRGLRGLEKEGFRRVHLLRSEDEVDAVELVRTKLFNDRRELTGPFDVFGDVHGCAAELALLLTKLGYELRRDDRGRVIGGRHPAGRTAVFVGDLVDRGPDTPGVLRVVLGMVRDGDALCVPGNHDDKLLRALRGRKVKVSHGLAESLEQLGREPDEFRAEVESFLDGLISHYVLDGGKLVVSHAGLTERLQGRASARVRSFCLYGETTGETDEFGLPVRYPWANDYRGQAMVLYGHTPVPVPEWVNGTLCLDTGCVFGGRLTALRYPERELVSVPAARVYYEPARPFPANTEAASRGGSGNQDVPVPWTGVDGPDAGATVLADEAKWNGDFARRRDPDVLDLADVTGRRGIQTSYHGRVTVHAENAAAALEVMSRFALDPRWLIYLPPTMSPVATSLADGLLERPEQAFEAYQAEGVRHLVCEEKHMGSRAVALVCRDLEAAKARFGAPGGATGAVWTRTGRSFFDGAVTEELLARLRSAAEAAGLFDELDTGWLLFDAELLPWSAKAEELVRSQYAAVGAAAGHVLPAAVGALEQAAACGLDVAELLDRTRSRAVNAESFRTAYRRYCWPTSGLTGVRFAPFQLLASEGAAHAGRPHDWHLDLADRLVRADPELIAPTSRAWVDLGDLGTGTAAIDWWEAHTESGGEGMVVKPADSLVRGKRGLVQPGLKVRGREYLRIIYGPDYTEPPNLERLRKRGLGHKRSLAEREYALGLEGLDRVAAGEPLWRVHECVFAVLALESEPVDPRL
ncbi:MAG TPA: polynucleotide kinase-phosphatase [Streptosporangiaceae bacterium]|nr:polynucleotide kinase-phosphatase [Streptosporangiaceae bacterium]